MKAFSITGGERVMRDGRVFVVTCPVSSFADSPGQVSLYGFYEGQEEATICMSSDMEMEPADEA